MNLRSLLYRTARGLGDVQAASKGRYPQRIARKAVYRSTNRLTSKALKSFGL